MQLTGYFCDREVFKHFNNAVKAINCPAQDNTEVLSYNREMFHDIKKHQLMMDISTLSRPTDASYSSLYEAFHSVMTSSFLCTAVKKPVNPCRPNPCMNDGVCVLLNRNYRCECRGWEGPHCETRPYQQITFHFVTTGHLHSSIQNQLTIKQDQSCIIYNCT